MTTPPLHTLLRHKALDVSEDGPVLRVILDPSAEDGALSSDALDDLEAVLRGLHDRPDIRVLVLGSAGDDFCLGADRTEFQDALEQEPSGSALRRIVDKAYRVCDALENTHAVTIARLNGKVIGAGLALAAYCDLRAGADTCRFRMPEIALGLPPAWGGAMGRLIVEAGAARIRELMLTCDPFDADTAHRLGLLHKVTPAEKLDAAIDAWIRPLVRRSPEALTLTKRMLTGYSRAARTADVALLDAHLLSAQIARPRP
ncbi:enoyl-CoA hydratase/isomerase family protein [Streptomyces thermodiastaticus]|uniref:enoyl-CoA hydratase/isomerase family protein n=1 Tax=Streptomyces thermodiastaticus TaxID=44061 RepID=UPI001678C559|nr:enoyl-CoA hydratase/isomerase family protein [Streptomyces thermodiastaticus]MCE7553120.1 enoyl-CoA hydratase/isomerase family protein [Streptomyces thermodiastaticus]GHF92908.1 enoyl-CoA hydratase [Streptomyces thermodiastaticus]